MADRCVLGSTSIRLIPFPALSILKHRFLGGSGQYDRSSFDLEGFPNHLVPAGDAPKKLVRFGQVPMLIWLTSDASCVLRHILLVSFAAYHLLQFSSLGLHNRSDIEACSETWDLECAPSQAANAFPAAFLLIVLAVPVRTDCTDELMILHAALIINQFGPSTRYSLCSTP